MYNPQLKNEGLKSFGGNERNKKNEMSQQAGHGGSRPSSQHFERPRWAHHMRSGVGGQPDQHGETRCAY